MVTMSVTRLVLHKPPLVAVSDKKLVPAEIALDAVMLSVDAPAPLIVSGLKLAPMFAGVPARPKVTVLVNPFDAVTSSAKLVLPPRKTVCDAGVAEILKLPTVTLKVRLFVHMPSVTETVMSEPPAWPAAGVTVSVRLVPLPPIRRFAFGMSD